MSRSNILILDDEHVGVQHLHDALSRAHDVVWTRNSNDALRKLAEPSSFDLIICGVHLANDSMLDFLKHVRAAANTKSTPFVCFRSGDSNFAKSADSQIKYVSQMLGATAYIAIPEASNPIELQKAIEVVLEPMVDKPSD